MLLISSCAAKKKVFFIGTTHSPTTQVDVYFFESSIKKQYDIVGKIGFDRSNNLSTEAIHAKYTKKAKEVGADGILYLENLCNPKSNAKTNVDIVANGSLPLYNASTSISSEYKENGIYLIKYK